VAAELKRELGLDTTLVVGSSGEFTVWLDDKLVAEKQHGQFPSPDDVVAAVEAALPQERV
jgi:hypothetical protein